LRQENNFAQRIGTQIAGSKFATRRSRSAGVFATHGLNDIFMRIRDIG
jgi:hypothetical protein